MQKTTIECDGCGKAIDVDSEYLVLESLRVIKGHHRSGNPGRQEVCDPNCLKKLGEKIVRETAQAKENPGPDSE